MKELIAIEKIKDIKIFNTGKNYANLWCRQ